MLSKNLDSQICQFLSAITKKKRKRRNEKEKSEKRLKMKLNLNQSILRILMEVYMLTVTDIVGPAHMKPVVSNGVWKGTEQISEMNDEQPKEDPAIKAKQKRADQIKKQVLLKKIQAVRQGGGENIMASYEPSNWREDKNMRINKLMNR